MTQEYLQQLTTLMQQVTSGKFRDVTLEYKHFFSGAAVYVDGRMCMSLTPAGFALKLPAAARDALMKERGAKHLRYFPTGPIKKDYVILPETILNDANALRRWVKASIEYARSLPEPVRKIRK